MTTSRDTTGRLHSGQARIKYALPPEGEVRRYLVTSAQNNTSLHEPLWDNLQAYAAHLGAKLLVATFTYNKAQIGAKGAKRKTSKEGDTKGEWWDPRLEPYVVDQSVELAPGLIWCGELQILPTAVDPLSGFDSYTGRASTIVPHPKFAVKSIPSPKHSGTKFMWTTGTVTLRNYIQKKAGLLAEFHHGYGALIVEVDSDGGWYVRQLNADSEGVFYDFDAQVKDGEVTFGHRPEAVVWGDIHVHWLAPKMRELCWGKDGLLDRLDPKVQVMHDVLDFHARKHHDLDDPWLQYAKIPLGKDCVEEECADAGNFLWNASRAWCKTLVVRSNHDDMLVKWLKFADWKADLLNAKFFFRAHLAMLHAIDRGRDFDIIEWALTRGDPSPGVYFLQRDERAIVCPDASGGIELG